MTTGKNLVRSIGLAAAAAFSLLAGTPTASAQGWDCGGPGWIRYPVLYTTAACQGVGEGACNIVCGVGKTCREIGYQGVDIVGGGIEICGGPRHQNWSQSGQYFDNGGSYGTYYRDFGGNVCTFGVYGQVQSTARYCNGEIDTNTYSEQMGTAGVFQLCQARVMYVQGGPGSVWRQPIQNVPAHLAARCRGQLTPYDIAQGARPGDQYISPACRARMDPLWEAACAEAEGQAGSCAAASGSPRGPVACRSGTPQTPAGPNRWRPSWEPTPNRQFWWPRDFFWSTRGTNRNGLTCAEPRALTCARRCGQEGSVPTTQGAVVNNGGSLYYRPPCAVCQSMGNMNPGLINWVPRPGLWRPTDVPFPGLPPPQVFDPRDQMGACPRPGNLAGGGGVDPPYEGDEDGGGCSAGGGAGSVGGLLLVGALLSLLVPRRRRRARPLVRAISIIAVLALSACGKQEDPAAKVAKATNIAACDRFIARYARCEKLSAQQRGGFEGALDQWKTMLKDGDAAIAKSVQQSCQKAAPGWERSLGTLGC